MNIQSTYQLSPDEYQKVQDLKKEGLAEWEAIMKVLDLTNDNFITSSTGTSSNSGDSLLVHFLQ